jgi:glycine/sarcosine N-methyltransferase
MPLYSRISRRYDDLFPVNTATIETVEILVPPGSGKKIVDMGAATGSLVRAFADRGWDAFGIELDGEMAATAASRAHVVQGSILDADLLVMKEYGVAARFAAVLCLGNTLPHLEPESLPGFFSSVRHLLQHGAPFIVQTVNYSHPAVGPGFVFPEIRSGDLLLERRYESGEAPGTIAFVTRYGSGGASFEDRTPLYPLKPGRLLELLAQAGFEDIETRSDWKSGSFDAAEDFYLLAVAR